MQELKKFLNLVEIYPDADIFSLVDFLNQKDREDVLNGKFAKTSFIQKLPFSKNHLEIIFFISKSY